MRKFNWGKTSWTALVLATILLLSTLSGCTQNAGAKVALTEADTVQVKALLGDLEPEAADVVRERLGILVHKVNLMQADREERGDYQITEKEEHLWDKITALLDEETIRQLGIAEEDADEDKKNVDYGQAIMKNLQGVLSKEHWNQLKSVRDAYLASADEENLDENAEEQMKRILKNYGQLDTQAVLLGLMEDKEQKSQSIFRIQPDLSVTYQAGAKTGLTDVNEKTQQDSKAIWQRIRTIIPDRILEDFQYFKITSDGKLGTYAYVLRLDDKGKKWCLSIDPSDVAEDGLFPYSIVHEMTHYLTLNEQQVDYFNEEWNGCASSCYSDYECVAKENSYLQAYYNRFWKYIINDWATNQENTYFYWRHQSQLVTAYAATNCGEDIAESFAAYVLQEEAPTPAIQEKFDFFEAYPELRQLKKDILANIEKNKIYVNPEIDPEFDEAA